jgi:hypothetical protein
METDEENERIRTVFGNASALYTNDRWKYHFHVDASKAVLELREFSFFDITCWDLTVENADDSVALLKSGARDNYLVLLSGNKVNPMKYLAGGVVPDVLLMKPFLEKDLFRALEDGARAVGSRRSSEGTLLVSVYNGEDEEPLNISSVEYIEMNRRALHLRIMSYEYCLNRSIEEIAEDLPDFFIRCHRAFVVNMQRVDRILPAEGWIIMKNGDRVPFSRKYRKEVLDYEPGDE